jgi:SnoaL-like domain
MEQDRSVAADEAGELLGLALRAIVAGDRTNLELFTEDVVIDSPNMHITGRAELEDQLGDRAGALTNIELSVDAVEVLGSGVLATWTVSGDHTGEVLFNEDELFEASGRRIHFSARSTAEIRGGLISVVRTDYDDVEL